MRERSYEEISKVFAERDRAKCASLVGETAPTSSPSPAQSSEISCVVGRNARDAKGERVVAFRECFFRLGKTRPPLQLVKAIIGYHCRPSGDESICKVSRSPRHPTGVTPRSSVIRAWYARGRALRRTDLLLQRRLFGLLHAERPAMTRNMFAEE